MGQIRTVHRGGSRFYVDTSKPVEVTVPGVTSVIQMLPKPFLQHWAAKMTAELAVDILPQLSAMAERDRQGAVDYLKGASRRYTNVRADIGSEAHDAFERQIRGLPVGRVSRDAQPYVKHFADFLTSVNPELLHAEDVAWSDTHGYAGSFDSILRIWFNEDGTPDPTRKGEPHDVVGDWKTGKSTYPDVSLQLAAYMNADRIVKPDGSSMPMPKLDGGVVLHVTPKGWALKPVDTSDEVFSYFLTLRKVFEWDREVSKRVIGRPVAQSGGDFVTGTERRAR